MISRIGNDKVVQQFHKTVQPPRGERSPTTRGLMGFHSSAAIKVKRDISIRPLADAS